MSLNRTPPYGTLTDIPAPNATVWTNAFHQGFQDRIDADPALQTYTPIWGSAGGVTPVLNNGVLTGQYTRKGALAMIRIALAIGSSTTFGTLSWTFSLPLVTASGTGSGPILGSALIHAAIAGVSYLGFPQFLDNQHLYISLLGSPIPANVTSTTPMAWAVNDSLYVVAQYWV